MAVRIPTAADLGFNDPRATTGVPSFPQEDPVAQGMSALGGGLQKAGQAAVTVGSYEDMAQVKMQRALADANWYTAAAELDGNLKAETDPAKITALGNQYQTQLQAAAAQISDPAAQQLWLAENQKHAMAGVKGAQLRNTGIYHDQYKAGIAEQGMGVVRAGAQADDPRGFDYARERINDLATAGQASGAMSAVDALAFRKNAEKQLIGGRAQHLANAGDPGAATSFLDQHETDLDPIYAEGLRARIQAKAEKAGIQSDINSMWGGSDKGYAGNRGGLNASAHYSYLTSIGATPNEAAMLTSAADSESSFRPDVTHDGGIGYGLYGHNGARLAAMRQEAGTVKPDWQAQAKFALAELRSRPEGAAVNAAKTPEDLTDAQMQFEQPNRNINNGNYAGRLASTREYMQSPPGTAAKVTWAPGDMAQYTQPGDKGAPVTVDGNTYPTVSAWNRAMDARAVATADQAAGATPAQPDQLVGQPAPAQASQAPAAAALPDIDAMTARVQARADSGEITQARADAVMAGLRQRYNHVQAAQANDRAALTKQLTNGAAALEDGKDFEYDPAQVRHFFPKEKADEILQVLQDSKDAGQVMAGVRTATPEDLSAQRQQLEAGMNDPKATDYAKRKKMLGALDAAIQKRSVELGKDPAGYVAQYSPNVATKFAAIDPQKPETFGDYATAALAEQERLGVPAEGRSILPAGVAAGIASKIAGIDPAKQNPGQVISATAQSYGQYWPQVFGDLVKAKLPGTYQVLATMDRPDQTVPAADLSRAIGLISEKGGMSALKKSVPDDTQKAIDKGLDDALADFRESVGPQSGGAQLYATVRDGAQALAYYYGFRGKSDSEAVKTAVDGIINSKYDFGSIGASQVRVPKGTMSVVDRAARAMQGGITADDLGPVPGNPQISPEQRKEIWLGAIRSGGWANNEDDSGLVLMGRFRNGAMGVVRRSDGSRIELKFASAPALATQAPPPEPPAFNPF